MKESISQRYGNKLEFCSLSKMTTSIFNCVVAKTAVFQRTSLDFSLAETSVTISKLGPGIQKNCCKLEISLCQRLCAISLPKIDMLLCLCQ